MTTEFSDETPLPDAVEQRREEVPPTEPEFEPIEQFPVEADVVEQHRVVPVDDEPLLPGH